MKRTSSKPEPVDHSHLWAPDYIYRCGSLEEHCRICGCTRLHVPVPTVKRKSGVPFNAVAWEIHELPDDGKR